MTHNAIAKQIPKRVERFNEQEMSNLVWAYATAGQHDASPIVFDAISNQISKRIVTFNNAQSLANMVWGYAAIQSPYIETLLLHLLHDHKSLKRIFSSPKAAPASSSSSPCDELLHQPQIYQGYLEWKCQQQHHPPAGVGEEGTVIDYDAIDDDMFLKFRKSLITQQEGMKSSKLHENVSKVLRKDLGLSIENEFVTREGYTVDIKVGKGLWIDATKTAAAALTEKNNDHVGVNNVVEKKPLCIEVDGPSHFYPRSKKYTTATLMKHRHLRAFGFHVISIPYWEWNRCRDIKAKKKYLRLKLEKRFRECS